jgi:hypothetical protein
LSMQNALRNCDLCVVGSVCRGVCMQNTLCKLSYSSSKINNTHN